MTSSKLLQALRKKKSNRFQNYIINLVILSSLVNLLVFSSLQVHKNSARVTINAIDGIISDGEYMHNISFVDGNFQIFWSGNGNEIIIGMRAKSTGWLAIGIDPVLLMQDADMVFGWVTDSGEVEIIDAFSTGPTGPHPPDSELGGTSDIIQFNGTEVDGTTTIEFKRLLNTGDSYDKPIPLTGDIKIIWAYSDSDSFEVQHVKTTRGSGRLNLQGASPYFVDFGPPFLLGTVFFLTLFILLIYVDNKGRKLLNNKHNNKEES